MEGNLTREQRQNLQIAVIVGLLLFLLGYFFFMFGKNINFSSGTTPSTNQVIFQEPLLKIFQYTETVTYPDTIHLHYPYLLLVRQNEGATQLYNLQTKKKDKKVNEVLLDYFEEVAVYNNQGKTYVDNTNLHVLCDLAFLKTKQDILCVTRPDSTKPNTTVISIDTKTLAQDTLYTSRRLITAIYYENNTMYLGEFDPASQMAFISVNEKNTSSPDWVNIIYPMQNNIYMASFKSMRNKNESFYKLTTDKIQVIQQHQDEIRFF